MENFNEDDIDWNELDNLAREYELEPQNIPTNFVLQYLQGAVKRRLSNLTFFIILEFRSVLPNDTELINMFVEDSDPGSAQFINLIINYGSDIRNFNDEDCPYRIENFLGRGTYGTVFQVRSVENPENKPLALKIIYDPNMISIVEIDLLTRLRHPALIHRQSELLTDVCGLEKGIAFAMPLARYNLYTLPPIAMSRAIEYFYVVLSGLKFLHDHNIIHLDISPYNILILNDDRIVLADFGLARQTQTGLYPTHQLKYTEVYRPLMDGRMGIYGTYSDIWALGATMFELFTGYTPESNDQNILNTQLSQVYSPIRPVLERMLVINPKNRATADELLQMNVFRSLSKLEGYIVPLPPIDPKVFQNHQLSMGLNSISEYEYESNDITILASDVFARLLSLAPYDNVYTLIHAATYIALEYYDSDSDPPEDLSTYLRMLDGYIYRGSDMSIWNQNPPILKD